MAEKLWFKIGEAAEAVGATPSEIRYWEKKIPEIRPRRSKGNLRYFHKDDLPKLMAVNKWIKSGFSAADCQELLLKGCVEHDLGMGTTAGNGVESETVQDERDDGWSTDMSTTDTHTHTDAHGQRFALVGNETRHHDHHHEAKAIPEPAPLPWLESVIDALKEVVSRLEKPVP